MTTPMVNPMCPPPATGGAANVTACMPPKVPKPKRGPCPGATRAVRLPRTAAGKAAPKSKAKPAADPGPGGDAVALARPVSGRDVTGELDYTAIRALYPPVYNSDQRLAAIAARQGFDGLPQVVTSQQMDQLVDAGNRELWRGVKGRSGKSATQMAQELRSGPAYYGVGYYGNGTYFTPDRSIARKYSTSDAGMVRAVLHPDARTITWEEAKARVDAAKQATKARDTAQRELFGKMAAVAPDQYQQAWEQYLRDIEPLQGAQADRDWVLADTSQWAAANGFDAITLAAPATGTSSNLDEQVILLNRTALIIEAAAKRAAKRATTPAGSRTAAGVAACLKPDETHPGPCKGEGKGEGSRTITRVRKAVARPKAVPRKPPAKQPAPARAGRVAGRDITGELDYGALAALPAKLVSGDEDQRLAAIARAQGFDGPPTLGTAADLDDLLAAGGHELFRGTKDYGRTSGEELARQLRTGRAFYGTGEYGSGMYFTPDSDEAFDYADFGQGGINRAVLPRDARIIDYPDLTIMARQAAPAAVARMQAAQQDLIDALADPAARAGALQNVLDVNAAARVKALAADTSMHAAAKGYDAIRLPGFADSGEDYWIILNRTALTVQDRDRDPSFAVRAGAAAQECERERQRECARTRVQACMPPKVPKPKRGPCPGAQRAPGPGGVVKTAGKAVAKARARKGAPGSGRDLSAMLNMESIAAQPRRTAAGGDGRLGAIAKEQGFDARAALVDAAALDQAISEGARPLFRAVKPAGGLSADQIHDRNATGPARFSKGIYGGGTYFSSDPMVARVGYGDVNSPDFGVRRSALHPDARTITYPQLLEAMAADTSTSSQRHQQRAGRLLAMLARGGNAADYRFAYEDYVGSVFDLTPQDALRTDPGAWAMSRGYDAIIVPVLRDDPYDEDLDEIVVLNRGAVLTERVDHSRTGSAAPARVEGCMPPTVPKPKRGPCPGTKRGAKKLLPPAPRALPGAPRKVSKDADVPDTGVKPKKTKGARPATVAPTQIAKPQAAPSGTRAVGRDFTGDRAALGLDTLMALPTSEVGKPAPRLSALGARQGFDGPPVLGEPRDLDALEKAGGVRMWRGTKTRKDPATGQVTRGRDFAKAFRTGPLWYGGDGLRGAGVYATTRVQSAFDKGYADRGDDLSVNEMVLHPDARVADYRQLVAQMEGERTAEQDARIRAYDDAVMAALDASGRPEQAQDAARREMARAFEALTPEDKLLSDSSTYAMSKGYDAVSHDVTGEERHYVLLNRTALTMLKQRGDDAVTASARRPGGRLEACMPPKVPRAQPGPCPGRKRPLRKVAKAVAAPRTGDAPPRRRREGVRTSLMLAETVEEVNEVTAEQYRKITGRQYAIPLSFGGEDVQIAREHAEGILQGFERFPQARVWAVDTFDSSDAAWAGQGFAGSVAVTFFDAELGSRIRFNRQYIDDPARYRAALEASSHGFLTVATPTGIALHEFGHAVGYQTAAQTSSKRIARALAASGGTRTSTFIDQQLSEYATDDDWELLAEAFTDVMTRHEKAAEVSQAIFAEVERRYQARTNRERRN